MPPADDPGAVQILGVRFFDGSPDEAVEQLTRTGGYCVVPAAPALVNIQYDPQYRRALVESDLAIADSGFMVLLWRWLGGGQVARISGLVYLQALVRRAELRHPGKTFWILPSKSARDKAEGWLPGRGFLTEAADFYVAPRYGAAIEDPDLLATLTERQPEHIIIAIGGGTQEKLGLYLRDERPYRPAIHCIGAALGFLTGDQKPIPAWADRLYVGWLLRLARDPRLYFRRFAVAHELPGLIARYGSELPPLKE